MRGVLLLLREHALADGHGVVHDGSERDALGVVRHVGALALARVQPYLVRSFAPAPRVRPSRRRISARSAGDSPPVASMTAGTTRERLLSSASA